MSARLTEAQKRILLHLLSHDTMPSGDNRATLSSLIDGGWVSPGYPTRITPAGRKALRSLSPTEGE